MYQIDDIDFTNTPDTFKIDFNYKDQTGKVIKKKVTLTEYFKLKYKKDISKEAKDCPLIIYTDPVLHSIDPAKATIYLPACLCRISSLGKDFTKNSANVKSMQSSKVS